MDAYIAFERVEPQWTPIVSTVLGWAFSAVLGAIVGTFAALALVWAIWAAT